jgi:hypothetical protein
LKRITRYKLALIFESANHRKFLGLFGSEAARLLTSNEATLEGYAIKHVFDLCDSIMKNVIVLFIKNMLQYLYILNSKKFFMADRKFKFKFGHTVIMNCLSLKAMQ